MATNSLRTTLQTLVARSSATASSQHQHQWFATVRICQSSSHSKLHGCRHVHKAALLSMGNVTFSRDYTTINSHKAWSDKSANDFADTRNYSSTIATRNNDVTSLVGDQTPTPTPGGDMKNTYSVAVISSGTDNGVGGATRLSAKNLSIQQIVKEIPGMHARDFISLALTSLGDASRKRRAAEKMNHYAVKSNIHPWFILPRESEIVVSSCDMCVRSV